MHWINVQSLGDSRSVSIQIQLNKTKHTMINERRALGFGIAAVMLWSTVATAFKLTLQEFTPIQMLTVASFVSALTLFVLCYFQGKINQIVTTFFLIHFISSSLVSLTL
ncbi:hypothetical protein [Vibrio algarum]|uniref:EamA domain-containing protein n=1 Tax=Vibrio algarum TaxID=3020714 RepID=A0ABT4YLV2_9VIBR|nr:hypothetical protein [Vibrio sp. KJ40-1]MDB1122529.1 hypothetical protein [Vibrio sp. KJ40-1]